MLKQCTLLLLGLLGGADNFLWSQSELNPGVKINDATYRKIPRNGNTRRGATAMPVMTSLRPFAPIPGNQGDRRTCLAWSVAYALTIHDAHKKQFTDPTNIQPLFYSPGFIYYHIKDKDDISCTKGAEVESALQAIQKMGVLRHQDLPNDCPQNIAPELIQKASQSDIPIFSRLTEPNENRESTIKKVKSELAVGNPVIIVRLQNGMGSDVMGHAMCVVGFDDTQQGGRFEVLNSMGPTWHGDGYEIIKYENFNVYYTIAVRPPVPKVGKPTLKPFHSKIQLLDASNQKLELKRASAELRNNRGAGTGTKTQAGHYIAKNAVTEGYGYQIAVDNNESDAYVYVLNFDTRGVVDLLFPHDDTTSAYIIPQNGITLPAENEMIFFDENKGYDYSCVLFSRNALDMKALKQKIEAEAKKQIQAKMKPVFARCLEKVLGEKLAGIGDNAVTYNQKDGTLSLNMETQKNIAALIIEFEHK